MRVRACLFGCLVALVSLVGNVRSQASCDVGEYLNADGACSCCPSFAVCTTDYKLQPKDELLPYYDAVDDSWTQVDGGNRRISACPMGFVKIYDADRPALDDCFVCPEGTYVLGNGTTVTKATEAKDKCLDCVIGATCPGGAAVLADVGFWRNEEAETESASVLPCQPDVCVGNNTCREGHHGEVCGKCLEGWVLANAGLCQNCETSGGMDKNTVKALVITAVVLASMALWYLFALRPLINPFLGNNRRFLNKIKACYKKIANFKNEATEKKNEATAKKQKALLTFSAIAKLQGIFKVVLSSFQISTSFLTIFSVDWPEAFTLTMGALWFTRLDILALPGIACLVSDVTYTSMLALKTMGPVLVAAALFIPSAYVLFMGWRHLTHDPIKSLADQLEDLRSTQQDIEKKDAEAAKRQAAADKLRRQESLKKRREEDANRKLKGLPPLPMAPEQSMRNSEGGKATTRTYYDVYLATLDRFWYALVLLFYIVFPMCSNTALSSFFCIDVGQDTLKLGHDPRWTCPRSDAGNLSFIISVAATMMWPIGLPFLLLIILEMYNVPALSADMRNSAALKAFLDNIGVSNKLSLGSSFIENLCRAFGKAPNDNYSTIAYLKAYSVFHLKTEMTMMKDQADPNEIKDKSDHDDEDDARKGGHGGKAAHDSASDGEGAGQDGTLHVGFMGKLKKKAKRKKKGARELERFAGAEKKDLAFLHYFFARTMFKCTLIKDYFEIWKVYKRDEEDEKRKLQTLDKSLPPSGSTQLENPSQFQVPLVKPKTLEDKVVEMATEMERIRTLVMEKRQQRAYVKSRKRRARGKKKMNLIKDLAKLDEFLNKYETLNVLDEKNINARDVHRFFDSYLKLSKSAQARLVEILHSAKRFFLPGYEPDAKEGGATPDAEDGGVTEEAQDALIAKLGIDAASAPMLDDDVKAAFDLLQDESFVACGQIEAPEDVVQPKKTAAAWCPCWPAKTQSKDHDDPDHDDPDPPQASWCLCWPKTESKDGIPQQGESVSGDNASKKQRPTTVHHMLLAFVNTLIAKEKVGVPVTAWRQADDKFLSPANLVRRSGPADRATKFNVYKGKADFVFLGDEEFQMTKTKAHGRAGFLYETYEVEFWYFEVVEMFRKLLMTSLPLFLFPGKPIQIACTIIISTGFLVVFMRLKPYLDPELDFLQSTTLLAQSATLFYGLLTVMADDMPNIGIETIKSARITGWIITLANIFCAIAPLLVPLFVWIKNKVDPELDKPVEIDLEKQKFLTPGAKIPKGACKLTALKLLSEQALATEREEEEKERKATIIAMMQRASEEGKAKNMGLSLAASAGARGDSATWSGPTSPFPFAETHPKPGQEGLSVAAAGTEAEAAGVGALESGPRSSRSRTSSTGADVAPTLHPTAQASSATLISGPGGDEGDRERMQDSAPAFESSPSVDASLGFSHDFPEAGQRMKSDGSVGSLSSSTSRQAELKPPSQPNMPAEQKQVNFRSGVVPAAEKRGSRLESEERPSLSREISLQPATNTAEKIQEKTVFDLEVRDDDDDDDDGAQLLA